MASYISSLGIIVLLTASATLTSAQSGSGTTTRYWDCCKPSCAWAENSNSGVVNVCDVNDQPLSDPKADSGCKGGPAYMCSSQAPWAVSEDLAYGFTAVSGANPACCQCFQLTFKGGPIQGKKMIVQATNTGGDVGAAQFDLAIPGGGFGIFDGCSTQWGATSNVWGEQYGGPKTDTCAQFPPQLQAGCGFRWGWMGGADNPDVDYEVVGCPAEIVAKSGCGAANGGGTPPASSAPSAQSPSDNSTGEGGPGGQSGGSESGQQTNVAQGGGGQNGGPPPPPAPNSPAQGDSPPSAAPSPPAQGDSPPPTAPSPPAQDGSSPPAAPSPPAQDGSAPPSTPSPPAQGDPATQQGGPQDGQQGYIPPSPPNTNPTSPDGSVGQQDGQGPNQEMKDTNVPPTQSTGSENGTGVPPPPQPQGNGVQGSDECEP